MWDWSVFWPAIASIFGGGSALAVAIQGIQKKRSGRAQRERRHNNDLKAKVDRSEAEKRFHSDLSDWEAAHRRRVQEFASRLLGKLAEKQVPCAEIPDWPSAPSGKPRREDYGL